MPVSTRLITQCWRGKILGSFPGTESQSVLTGWILVSHDAVWTQPGDSGNLLNQAVLHFILCEKCLWHRDTSPFYRSLTGFCGFTQLRMTTLILSENHTQSVRHKHTLYKHLQIQKKGVKVSFSHLCTDVGRNLPQNYSQIWQELNIIYIWCMKHNLHPGGQLISFTNPTDIRNNTILQRDEKINCEWAKHMRDYSSLNAQTFGTGDKDASE